MREIRLEGPGKNALGTDLMMSVLGQLEEARGEAVLFTGQGDAFSAGLDLREVASLDVRAMDDFLRRLDRFFQAVSCYPGPTVAAINGHAIAGGCVLALCCDLRVLAKNPKLKMGLNEVALGLRFPPVTWRICRERVGRAHESEILLGAKLFDPDDAVRVGLVDELADDVVATARQRLEALAAFPRRAYSAAKYDLRRDFDSQSHDEAVFQDILPAWTSGELKARLHAMLSPKKT